MQSNTTIKTEDEFISEVEAAFNESNEEDKPTQEILDLALKAVPIITESFDLSNISVDAWCGCVEYWAGAIRGPVTYCDTFMNLEFGEQGAGGFAKVGTESRSVTATTDLTKLTPLIDWYRQNTKGYQTLDMRVD